MAGHRKFRVYLAGPIANCNEAQRRGWREEVKGKFGDSMEFIDPMDAPLDGKASPYALVREDLAAIEAADGLLVNMWRESIGSAIGVVHAHGKGRPVVVANPNRLEHKMLEFYADAMEDAPAKAAKALRDLLRAEANWSVIKAGGRGEEPFQRRKLSDSIRVACREAGRDDIVIPRLVLPKAIGRLMRSDRKLRKTLTARDVDAAVEGALEEVGADPAHRADVAEVVAEWRGGRARKKTSLEGGRGPAAAPERSAVRVPVSCGKSHGTIWGKTVTRLEDIPSAKAREALSEICRVPGITRISLGRFGRKERRAACGALVVRSDARFVIEGKLFDDGPKGTMQAFQVRVQDDSRKDAVAADVRAALEAAGFWAG